MVIIYQNKRYKLVYSTDKKINDLIKELRSSKRKRIKHTEFSSKS